MARHRRKIHKTSAQIQPELPGGTVTIERLAHGGYGVGSLDGLTVFVPRTAPGDVVDVRLTEQRRRYAFGTVVAVRQTSPWRVEAPCLLYDHCGGCSLHPLPVAAPLSRQ